MLKQETLYRIAKDYGTPAYVFDLPSLKNRVENIRSLWGEDISLCYSIKANPFLIPAMLECVDHLEVCSPGELKICEALSAKNTEGMDCHKIVYSGVSKGKEDIADAISDGAGIYTAESIHQLDLLQEGAQNANTIIPTLLRLNSESQFGMSKEDLCHCIEHRAEYPNIRIEGVHYFAGTQRKNKEWKKQKEELAMLKEFFDTIEAEYGFRLKKLEYGPGLPVPLFASDDYSDTLRPAKEIAGELKEVTKWAELTVEMGRFFATECGYYLTKVMDVKSVEQKNYCIVDGGIHHVNYLGQIMGMKVPVIEILRDGKSLEKTESEKEWAICGSLCTTNDDLVRSYKTGNLQIDDLMIFGNIGAYSITEGIYLFLSRTMPKVLAYTGEEIKVLRDFTETAPINTPSW